MDQCLCPPASRAPSDDGLLDRADADLAADRHEAALQRVWSVLARWPDHPRALALLGRVLEDSGGIADFSEIVVAG